MKLIGQNEEGIILDITEEVGKSKDKNSIKLEIKKLLELIN